MYRSPEMLDTWNNHVIGPQLDVWALGCILYYPPAKVSIYNFGNRNCPRLPPPVRTVEAGSIYTCPQSKAPHLHGMFSVAEDMYGFLTADPKSIVIVVCKTWHDILSTLKQIHFYSYEANNRIETTTTTPATTNKTGAPGTGATQRSHPCRRIWAKAWITLCYARHHRKQWKY